MVPIKKRRLDHIDQNKDSKQIEGFKEQVAYFEMNRRRSKRSDVVSFYVNKVVRTAARRNQKDLLEYVIYKSGLYYDINSRNENGATALLYACSYDFPEMVRFLLKQPKIDINICESKGYSPLMWAYLWSYL